MTHRDIAPLRSEPGLRMAGIDGAPRSVPSAPSGSQPPVLDASAHRLAALAAAVGGSPDIRPGLVERVRAELASGTHPLDAMRTARAILGLPADDADETA